eukprot:15356224-Ditylum_brightwellii.AAC.1
MPGVYKQVKKNLNKVCRKNKLVTSSCLERTKTKYQPGGTATLVTTAKINTVCASGNDKYGRWSFVTLKGNHKWKVTVITAYREHMLDATMVGSTKKDIAAPDPHKHFMKDFEVFIEEYLNKSKEPILGMDVNEDDSSAAEIQQL